MRIRVDEIPESGRFLHFHWDDARFRQYLPTEDPFEFKLLRPLNVDLEIQKRADHIRVQGTLRGTLEVTCHRCLTAFAWRLEEPVDVFLFEGEEPQSPEDLEFETDELEYEFFDGVIIEIDQLVAEQIFLALPVKILCSEDCQGLCPRCGANLNEERCRCEKSADRSPFTALEAIKARLAGAGND